MIEVTAPIWLWNPARGAWHFLTVPAGPAAEIRRLSLGSRGGFGSVSVSAKIGKTIWKTSVFPDKKSGVYLLPIKAEVRRRLHIAAGDVVTVILDLA